MRYLKLFEEMNRITVTNEEKDQLRDITRFYLSILKDRKIWDFTGGKIIVPINDNREHLDADMFSIMYHEFIHSKDPDVWLPVKDYSSATSQKAGIKGSYGSHKVEIQTMFGNLLELITYYFERTWRGDTDGGGLNYNLTKEELMKNFFPTLIEVKDFIRNKRTDLSQNAMEQLSGTNKGIKFIKTILNYMNDAKKKCAR